MAKILYCGTVQDRIKEFDIDYSAMSLTELVEFNIKHEVVKISARRLSKWTREDFIYKFNQRLEMWKQTERQGY